MQTVSYTVRKEQTSVSREAGSPCSSGRRERRCLDRDNEEDEEEEWKSSRDRASL
jgi:hypothetical protein